VLEIFRENVKKKKSRARRLFCKFCPLEIAVNFGIDPGDAIFSLDKYVIADTDKFKISEIIVFATHLQKYKMFADGIVAHKKLSTTQKIYCLGHFLDKKTSTFRPDINDIHFRDFIKIFKWCEKNLEQKVDIKEFYTQKNEDILRAYDDEDIRLKINWIQDNVDKKYNFASIHLYNHQLASAHTVRFLIEKELIKHVDKNTCIAFDVDALKLIISLGYKTKTWFRWRDIATKEQMRSAIEHAKYMKPPMNCHHSDEYPICWEHLSKSTYMPAIRTIINLNISDVWHLAIKEPHTLYEYTIFKPKWLRDYVAENIATPTPNCYAMVCNRDDIATKKKIILFDWLKTHGCLVNQCVRNIIVRTKNPQLMEWAEANFQIGKKRKR
jgi:hypothetical protein